MNTEDVTDPLELDDIEAGRLAETQAENSSRAEPVEEEEPHMLRILDPMNRADLGAIAINLRLRDFAFTAREEFESNPAEHKKYLFLKEGKLAPHIHWTNKTAFVTMAKILCQIGIPSTEITFQKRLDYLVVEWHDLTVLSPDLWKWNVEPEVLHSAFE